MEALDPPKESTIGELIKVQLKKQLLSMRKLSSLSGMDTATISRIVNGKQEPKLVHLKLFSEYLDLSLDRLIEASGYTVNPVKETGYSHIHQSLGVLLELFGDSSVSDLKATTGRIEQELAKYELYAQTEEGHGLICREFEAKLAQVNGVGPLIDQLKEMYTLYCAKSASETDQAILGSALLYFILSADIIPDYMFPIGYVDDAMAVYLVLDRLSQRGFPHKL
ncbi:transcriptional regulator [Paenibacillus chitinolyticus]|uniref:helix-turn-helix domain-containing protein n=1 Tax=Paenibacillus chitinolyticus TaxID=79263 RepID=UPI0026E4C544|nr:helix-turn-helix domain-containing protein [Paenibacillus chitinolyticus]GKS12717.1 transcriptional regulator [Paenibacillus chitinolyticus]